MRTTSLCSSLLLTLATLTGATSTAPATAAAESVTAPRYDWRARACTDMEGLEVELSGPRTVLPGQVTRVEEVDGMRITVDRLDFGGVTCELLRIGGPIPAGTDVTVVRGQWCSADTLAVNGVATADHPSSSCEGVATPVRLHRKSLLFRSPKDVSVLVVSSYRAQESGVFEDEEGLPPEWVGAPWTQSVVQTSWGVRLRGTTLVEQPFARDRRTDRAASVALSRAVSRAEAVYRRTVREIEERDLTNYAERELVAEAAALRAESVAVARRTHRLALRGIRLVPKKFSGSYSGLLAAPTT